MPNARYVVDIGHHGGRFFRFFEYRGTTDSTGHLAQSVAQFDLASGDDLLLACYFVSGDIYAIANIVR